MANERPAFGGVHIFVRNMDETSPSTATLAWKLRPGRTLSRARSCRTVSRSSSAQRKLSKAYDPGWREPSGVPASALQFRLPSRQAVDDLYATLTAAGHNGHLPPFDAYWGSRYAEIDDPNGNIVGLQSPRDPSGQVRRHNSDAALSDAHQRIEPDHQVVALHHLAHGQQDARHVRLAAHRVVPDR